MSKTLTPNSIKKIEDIIIKKIWKNRKISTWSNFQKIIRKTYEEIKPIGNFGKYVDEHDFFEGVDIHKIHGRSSSITIREFRQQIRNNLFINHNFDFFVRVPSAYGFPNGIKIGNAEAVGYSNIPINIWNWDPFTHSRLTSFKGTSAEKDLFLKFSINSIGNDNARKLLENQLENSLHILRFLFHDDIQISEYFFIMDGGKSSGSSHHNFIRENIGCVYSVRFQHTIDTLNQIFTKISLNELEERIKKAIIILSISRGIRFTGFRFSVLCTALEALFITRKDPITEKLAERVSFLIRFKGKKRIEIYKEIKNLYDKRSDFIHQEGKNEISEKDFFILSDRAGISISKFLELRTKGYTNLSSTGHKSTSVIDLIDSIKFGQTKKS